MKQLKVCKPGHENSPIIASVRLNQDKDSGSKKQVKFNLTFLKIGHKLRIGFRSRGRSYKNPDLYDLYESSYCHFVCLQNQIFV